jgi:hypothetical protein
MALGTKYRGTFKDYYGNAIQVDIKQEGYSSTITTLELDDDPLTIEWPSVRDDIMDPVRGGLATLNFYATSENQFSEFFDAYTKEYQMEISRGGSVYWTGWVMLGDYMESLSGAPYQVQIKANDLGFLKYDTWDIENVDADTILSILDKILDATGIILLLNERVNIYEDSIASGDTDSPLKLIDIQERSFVNSDWEGMSLYDALSRIMLTFGCFIMQENDYWNICRIPDMRVSHRYRLYSGILIQGNGAEDTSSDLSTYSQMFRSGIILTGQNYKTLTMTRDNINMELVNGTAFAAPIDIPDITVYWTKNNANLNLQYGFVGDIEFREATYFYCVKLNDTTSNSQRFATHTRTYDVKAGTRFSVIWQVYYNSAGSVGSGVPCQVKLVGASTYYLKWSDGTWSLNVNDAAVSLSADTLNEESLVSDELPIDGTLSFILYEGNYGGFAADGSTWHYLSVKPAYINSQTYINTYDFSEEIEADSLELEVTEQIVFHYGDAYEADGYDIQGSPLQISATGAATDTWQSKAGSASDELLEITRDIYEAQYVVPAKRIQADLRKDGIEYLDVIEYNNAKYLPSSLTYNVRDSEMRGEWIEIQFILAANQVDDYTNGLGASLLYDVFSESANTVTLEKTGTGTAAYVTVEDIDVTDGVRYYFVADITVNSGDVPNFQFRNGGETKTDLVAGENIWEMISDVTSATNDMHFWNTPAETFDGEITFTVQEMTGL